MNYLSGAFRFVAGTDDEPQNLIPRLIDRIKTSALPHDRRNAIVQLTHAAKESPHHQVQVGELSLKIILAILEQDSDYDETLLSVLELLISICGTIEPLPSTDRDQFLRESRNAAATNIDVFLGLPNALPLLLQAFDKQDFHIKFNAIELLAAMAANSRQTLQAAILEAPQGVARICDLLQDANRQIRFNCVVLLSSICNGSPEICKIVVFSSALEKLFTLTDAVVSPFPRSQTDSSAEAIDDGETAIEDGILLEDVLTTVNSLILGTPSTKTFFRDSGCIQRIVNILQRLTSDASFVSEEPDPVDAETPVAHIQIATKSQARKNLHITLACISGLISGSDEETILVRNDISSAEVLRSLIFVALPSLTGLSHGRNPPSYFLQVRIDAFKSLSLILQAHNHCRSLFNSSEFTGASNPNSISSQVNSFRTMMSDPSIAVRMAAYAALKVSFVADAGANAPCTPLYNAMTFSGASVQDSFLQENDQAHGLSLASLSAINQSDGVSFIANSMKKTLITCPSATEFSGTLFVARIFAWMLSSTEGAREQLLNSNVNGFSFLSQIVRSLAKCERETCPPIVRVSLLSVTCVWLFQSPLAVSIFLSSAMHLSMIVHIINMDVSHVDTFQIIIRGLAATLLGICLWAADVSPAPLSGSKSIDEKDGTPIKIPRGVLEEIIRSRIGVTEFVSCLDELRSSNAFSVNFEDNSWWNIAEKRAREEERQGHGSLNETLSLQLWVNNDIVSIVEDVSSYMSVRALDLVSGPSASYPSGKEITQLTNGHTVIGSQNPSTEIGPTGDSTQDEVLQSYKDFIRSQDDLLNAARLQVEELSSALQEAQSKLDRHEGPEVFDELRRECRELRAQKSDLEALLSEKLSDFEAVSNALSALEDDQKARNDSLSFEELNKLKDELRTLRSNNDSLVQSLEGEMEKNIELSHSLQALKDLFNKKEAEMDLLQNNKDCASCNIDATDATDWRTRAEIAETALLSREAVLQELEEKLITAEKALRISEHTVGEANMRSETLQSLLEKHENEIKYLQEKQDRDALECRNSSLSLALHPSNEGTEAQERSSVEASDIQRFEKPPSKSVFFGSSGVNNSGGIEFELAAAKQELSELRSRSAESMAVCTSKVEENTNLRSYIRELQETIASLQEKLALESHASISHCNKAADLEQQCAELDELRHRIEDEATSLRKELDLRTEQSIFLSGQIYEMEESRAKIDEEVHTLRQLAGVKNEDSAFMAVAHSTEKEKSNSIQTNDQYPSGKRAVLPVSNLKSTKETTSDIQQGAITCNENLPQEDAASKLLSLEKALFHSESQKKGLEDELNVMKNKLLCLEEAEDAKKILTLEVFKLKKALDEIDMSNSYVQRDEVPESVPGESLSEVEKLNKLTEAQLSKIENLEMSLDGLRRDQEVWQRERSDYENQVSVTTTKLNSLQLERDQLRSDVSRLSDEVDRSIAQSRAYSNLAALEEELKICRDSFESLQTQFKNVSEALENKDREFQLFIASSNNRFEALQEDLGTAEENLQSRSKEVNQFRETSQRQEKEIFDLENMKNDLMQELNSVRSSFEILHAEMVRNRAEATVENFVSTIVESIAHLTTESVFEKRIRDLSSENVMLRDKVNRLFLDQHAVEVAYEERNDAVAACTSLKTYIGQLEAKLDCQRELTEHSSKAQPFENAAMCCSEDKICSSKTSGAMVHDANLEKVESCHELATPSSITKLQKRVVELENALRDAARTVSSTNTELLAAQALLVDLSSDKTAMRAKLSSAEQHILELKKEVRGKYVSTSEVISDVGGNVSEISDNASDDVDVSPDLIDESYKTSLLEEEVKASQVEINNLRLALARSVESAKAAEAIVTNLISKVDLLECHLIDSRTEIEKSKKELEKSHFEIQRLNAMCSSVREEMKTQCDALRVENLELTSAHTNEVKKLQESTRGEIVSLEGAILEAQKRSQTLERECEKLQEDVSYSNKLLELEKVNLAKQYKDDLARLGIEMEQKENIWNDTRAKLENQLSLLQAEKDNATRSADSERTLWRDEKAKLLQQHEKEINQLTSNAALEMEKLKAYGINCEAQSEALKSEKQQIFEDFKEASVELEKSRKFGKDLELSCHELNKLLAEREDELIDLKKLSKNSDEMVQTLTSKLAQNQKMVIVQKEKHDKDLKQKVESWKNESKEYEEEIERVTLSMENMERQLRDAEFNFSRNLEQLRDSKQVVHVKLNDCIVELEQCKRSLEESQSREYSIRNDLEQQKIQFKNMLHNLNSQLTATQNELIGLKGIRRDLEGHLRSSKEAVTSLEKRLAEELDRRCMLEEENLDFARNVEHLEQRCKRVDDMLKQRVEECKELESQRASVADRLEIEKQEIVALQNQVREMEDQMRDLEDFKNGVELELEETQTKLKEAEAQCSSSLRDNEDLREWVRELEKKAMELQSVANEFEEVEQSLRETLNAQQQNEKEIDKLEEDLRKVREDLRQSETRTRKAERDKEALGEEKNACERKARELEERLLEIRELSVMKLSASEASVRNQAKRCAELETSLAKAERQIAEYGSATDEAFAAKAEARQLRDETMRLRDRCKRAEIQVEKLEGDLQAVREEADAFRKGSSEGQLRALEAEHNELLVYLADLELELTSLREDTEQES